MNEAAQIIEGVRANLTRLSTKRLPSREDQRRERQVKKQQEHLLDETVWNSDWQRKKELVRDMLLDIYTHRGKPGIYMCFTAATFGKLGRLDGVGRQCFLSGFKDLTRNLGRIPSLQQLAEDALDARVDQVFRSMSTPPADLDLFECHSDEQLNLPQSPGAYLNEADLDKGGKWLTVDGAIDIPEISEPSDTEEIPCVQDLELNSLLDFLQRYSEANCSSKLRNTTDRFKHRIDISYQDGKPAITIALSLTSRQLLQFLMDHLLNDEIVDVGVLSAQPRQWIYAENWGTASALALGINFTPAMVLSCARKHFGSDYTIHLHADISGRPTPFVNIQHNESLLARISFSFVEGLSLFQHLRQGDGEL
ncbi:hypothetical protein G7Y79_00005g016930 [Physcia stellaris]|nr:hypothetical protein G7Y79_00005g016930 [Physcia stellaris]